MLTIVDTHATPNPSRGFAEEVWRNDPAVHAAWWRENLGFTHSKLALDMRHMPRPVPQGMNLVLATPETLPKVLPLGVVRLVEVHNPADTTTLKMADVCVWKVASPLSHADALAGLLACEHAVREGTCAAYGIADDMLGDAHTPWPLHRWLEVAAEAAEQAWGRKKRPALRLIQVPMDILEMGVLFTPNTRHREEGVTALELAARLGLWVVAVPEVWASSTAPVAALEGLAAVAEAEAALHAALLGQWPHWHGAPLFSVLAALRAGQAPWPVPHALRLWRNEAEPALFQALSSLTESAEATELQAAWQRLRPLLPALAAAAAAPLAARALAKLQPRLPQALQALSPDALQAALLASVPGVGAVAVPPEGPWGDLKYLPDVADMGAVLMEQVPSSTTC